jgi:hypothetical protein
MALKSVKGTIIVTDQKGKKHTINADDLDFEEVERHPQQMGPEIRYSAENIYEGWSITVDVWEYPLGDKNHEDIDVGDLKYEGGFDYEFEA